MAHFLFVSYVFKDIDVHSLEKFKPIETYLVYLCHFKYFQNLGYQQNTPYFAIDNPEYQIKIKLAEIYLVYLIPFIFKGCIFVINWQFCLDWYQSISKQSELLRVQLQIFSVTFCFKYMQKTWHLVSRGPSFWEPVQKFGSHRVNFESQIIDFKG